MKPSHALSVFVIAAAGSEASAVVADLAVVASVVADSAAARVAALAAAVFAAADAVNGLGTMQ